MTNRFNATAVEALTSFVMKTYPALFLNHDEAYKMASERLSVVAKGIVKPQSPAQRRRVLIRQLKYASKKRVSSQLARRETFRLMTGI